MPGGIARDERGNPWPPKVGDVASRHFLRRRARKRAADLEAAVPGSDFRVTRAERGPYRYRVWRAA